MKAYAIQDAFGIDALAPVERQTTTPHYGEARVRVQAVSLNYRDLMTVTDGASRNLQLPLIPLSDGAGEVVAVGEGGTRVQPGDRAFPFEQTREAFKDMQSAVHFGKIVITL